MKLSDFGPTTRAEYMPGQAVSPRCPQCKSFAITFQRDADGVLLIACKEEDCQRAEEAPDFGASWEWPRVCRRRPWEGEVTL